MDPEKSQMEHRRSRRSNHASPFLRTLLLVVRIILLLCSLYLLGLFIFRYIRRSKSASTLVILILSGVSTLWSFLSLFSTCFGHTKVSGFNSLVDAVHVGAMIAISILLRRYAKNVCSGMSGKGLRDCNMLRAAFGMAVGMAVLYAIATLFSIFLLSAFRRGRPYGPSPENGYHSDNNPSPSNRRRGYITPDLYNNTQVTNPTDVPGFRQSTYTTNSALTDTNHTANDGSLTGRDSTGDTAGLLNAPPATYGQRHNNPNKLRTFEPYRAPTPVGGRNQGDFVEMPVEKEYGGTSGHGYGHTTGNGGYAAGSAF